MTIQLDDWQESLVNEAVGRYTAQPLETRHMICAPTGGGKTEIGIAIAKKYLEDNPTHCVGWLSERTILRNESVQRIQSAGLRVADHCKETVGTRWLVPSVVNVLSPQTFCERGKGPDGKSYPHGMRPPQYDVSSFSESALDDWWSADAVTESAVDSADNATWGLLIADECHHSIADFYGSVIRSWRGPVIGLTATAWLLNPKQALGQNMASPGQRTGPFETLTFGPTPAELVGKRLSDIEITNVPYRLQMERRNLRMNRMSSDGYDGDSVDTEVDRLLAIGDDIVDAWLDKEIGCARPTLWFTRTQEAARKLCELFEKREYKTAIVIADTPEDERRKALDDLMAGRIQCLASVDVFGEGVNVPNVNSIGMLRPTCSLTKHRQFLGRGLRIRPDGSPLYLMDFAGNCSELGTPLAEKWDGYFDPDRNMGLKCRKLHKGEEAEAFPMSCKECGNSVNWNQEVCSNCHTPISWVCENSRVVFTVRNENGELVKIERNVAGCWVRHYWKRFEKRRYETAETISGSSCHDSRAQEYERLCKEMREKRQAKQQAEWKERERERQAQIAERKERERIAEEKRAAEKAERKKTAKARQVKLPIAASKDDVQHQVTFINGVAIVMQDGMPVDSFNYGVHDTDLGARNAVMALLENKGYDLGGDRIIGYPKMMANGKWGCVYTAPAGMTLEDGDLIEVDIKTAKGIKFKGEYMVEDSSYNIAQQVKKL